MLTSDRVTDIDLVQIFLKEISEYPVLSREEEIELAKRISKGDKLAKEYMIKCNLRLVVSIAKKYKVTGYALIDLIQDGSMGLMKAIEKYNYKLGFRFSTYATWWIKQFINKAINNNHRLIQIPAHYMESINNLLDLRENLFKMLGREPSIDELSERASLEIEKVAQMLQWSQDVLSLDIPMNNDDDSYDFLDLIQSDEEGPLEEVLRRSLRDQIERALNTLSLKEKDVVIQRFGLDTGILKTLQEISKQYGVSKEYIRQVEKKALEKLSRIYCLNPLE